MPKNNDSGFTLIELIIVIAVIGVLSAVLIMVLDIQEYQAQARDARRMNDILSVQTALIDSMATTSIQLVDTTGCADCTTLTGTLDIYGNGWVKFTDLKGKGLIDVISNLPEDPVNDATYYFSYFSDGIDFELNMVFESRRYAENAALDGGNDDTVYERGFKLDLN
ncbi:type II secretion system protein [Patescibacteria group bacterium]